jgi:hypothetical protein
VRRFSKADLFGTLRAKDVCQVAIISLHSGVLNVGTQLIVFSSHQ